MKDAISEIMENFSARVEKSKITDVMVIELIKSYHNILMASYDTLDVGKRLNSVMVLRLLVLSGDDAWVSSSPTEFHKAYRAWGVIYSRGLGSYDDIMWNLIHMDDLIWQALEEVGIS